MQNNELLDEIEACLEQWKVVTGPCAGCLPNGQTIQQFMADQLQMHMQIHIDEGETFAQALENGVSYMHSHIVCDGDDFLGGVFFNR